MKRFISKISRFFSSRGFLKFVLWTVTLIVFFYVEEDWRGARAWAATKAKWEARGETFDFSKMIPPPVPDSENLATIPLFKMEPDPQNGGELAPLRLQRAFPTSSPDYSLMRGGSGNWQNGMLPDINKSSAGIASVYATTFKSGPLRSDPLAQFNALFPEVATLETAAATRSHCRFFDYRYEPSIYRYNIAFLTAQITVAKVLSLHAVIALDTHQSEMGLSDIETNLKLIRGLQGEPFFVSELIAIADSSIGFSAIYDGLTRHAWNDAQLSRLQEGLAKIDFLSGYQRALRGEAFGAIIPGFDRMKLNQHELALMWLPQQIADQKAKIRDFAFDCWAVGWIDSMKSIEVDSDLTAIGFLDPKARLVFPKTIDRFTGEIAQQQRSWDAYLPWNIFRRSASSAGMNASKSALAQVWIDEARIVCGLERYRLVNSTYPESLGALVPHFIDALPHDICGGQPYHYTRHADGTYVLYSIGWDEVDSGGRVVFEKDSPEHIDYDHGDWVWPMPK